MNKELDYTSKDYRALLEDMKTALQTEMPEYTDTSDTDAGMVILSLVARGLDILSYNQDRQANETFLSTMQRRDNILDRSRELGYIPSDAQPSCFPQVFVLTKGLEEDKIIPSGTVVMTKETESEEAQYFETFEDLVIPSGMLGNEQDEQGNYIYTVSVYHGQTFEEELVGTSNGAENQEFFLENTPVLIDTVTLLINEGVGYQEWTKVDSFVECDSTSKVFQVHTDEDGRATIKFGDGQFGKIPAEFSNGIYAYYRTGGGVIGNVSPGQITELEESDGEIAETFNLEVIEKGYDAESNESIKVNAPNHRRTQWGAITLKDYSDLVIEHFNPNNKVFFAQTLQNPADRDDAMIYILPHVEYIGSESDLINEVETFFVEEGRQVVGATCSCHIASFNAVDLSVRLSVMNTYYQAEVQLAVEEYLKTYFALGNIDFTTTVNLTELESLVKEEVEGVNALRIMTPTSDIEPVETMITTLGNLVLDVTGGVTVD